MDKLKEFLATIIAAVGFLLMLCFAFVVLWFGNFMLIFGILIIAKATNPFFPAIIIGLFITIYNIKKGTKE